MRTARLKVGAVVPRVQAWNAAKDIIALILRTGQLGKTLSDESATRGCCSLPSLTTAVSGAGFGGELLGEGMRPRCRRSWHPEAVNDIRRATLLQLPLLRRGFKEGIP